MQEKYWLYMVQIKAWIYYLEIYAESSYKFERNINMFCSIASSSSIAAWAVWNKYSFVWAFIIAVFQVLTTVRSYLPYNRRLKILLPFIENMKLLYNKIEFSWLKVASGDLTEEEINELLFAFKDKFVDIENKFMGDDILIERIDFQKIADDKTELYFRSNFGGE